MKDKEKKAIFNEIDKRVGAKIRNIRISKGKTQHELAKVLGVTFQQVQKYERGINKIGSSKLLTLAKHLKVPVAILLDVDLNTTGDREKGEQDQSSQSRNNYLFKLFKTCKDLDEKQIKNIYNVAQLISNNKNAA